MPALAANNAVTPLVGTPPPSPTATTGRAGAADDGFASALQRRLDHAAETAAPQRDNSHATRERQAPTPKPAKQAASGQAVGDGKSPTQAAEDKAAGADDGGKQAVGEVGKKAVDILGALDKASKTDTSATAAADAEDDTVEAAAIPGIPAAIAAILQDLAARHVNVAAGKTPATACDEPRAAGRVGGRDIAGDPLHNRAAVGSAAEDKPGDGAPATFGAAHPATHAAALQAAVATGAGTDAAPGSDRAVHALQGQPDTSSLAAAMTGAAHASPADNAPAFAKHSLPELPVSTPAGQPGWADEVGSRVTLLVGHAESKAELVLTPPHLGRIEVSLKVDGDGTTAQFVAATPAARDALEQAMPRLREVLQQAGIALGQANVSTSGEQQARQDSGQRRSGGTRTGEIGGIEAASAGSGAAAWLRRSEGMVDTFA